MNVIDDVCVAELSTYSWRAERAQDHKIFWLRRSVWGRGVRTQSRQALDSFNAAWQGELSYSIVCVQS